MPLLECHYHNYSIHQESTMHILVPSTPRPASGFPVLYLLHGLSESHSSWLRKTNLEYLSRNFPFLIVMADAGRSFYTGAYWQFFAEELPVTIANMFPVDSRPKATFIAGQSMGAFGALKLALQFPQRFRAAAAMAPLVGVNEFVAAAPPDYVDINELQSYFGDFTQSKKSENNLLYLIRQATAHVPIYLCCGDEDFLLPQNRKLAMLLEQHHFPLDFVVDSGCHSWDYFNDHIVAMLDFFMKKLYYNNGLNHIHGEEKIS